VKSAALTPTKRQKESNRSKSPFRSFRWKKAKSPAAAAAAMPGSASDDESNLERAAGKSEPKEKNASWLCARHHLSILSPLLKPVLMFYLCVCGGSRVNMD
jgi:hypothetical protein